MGHALPGIAGHRLGAVPQLPWSCIPAPTARNIPAWPEGPGSRPDSPCDTFSLGSPSASSAPFPNWYGLVSPRQRRETYQPGLKGQDLGPVLLRYAFPGIAGHRLGAVPQLPWFRIPAPTARNIPAWPEGPGSCPLQTSSAEGAVHFGTQAGTSWTWRTTALVAALNCAARTRPA